MIVSFLRRAARWCGLLLTITGSYLIAPYAASAQNAPAPCGTVAAQQRRFGAGYAAHWQQYRARVQALSTVARARRAVGQRPAVGGARLIIPVVVHIIHDGGSSVLTDEQIFDAIRILNEDFAKGNADTALVVPDFRQRVGDVNLEFRLARRDPAGACTNGITRTYSNLTNIADDNVKGLISWDGARYLNIWVVKSISFGAAGYAYLPCDVGPDIDGIVILNGYIGSVGAGNPRNSRALTHEVGHYLGLPHTWGGTNAPNLPANCFDDDGVWDTPNTIGSAPGNCNLRQPACVGDPDSLSNVQNYMDYSYCSVMFTEGQAELMYDGLTTSSFGSCHATLTTAANLTFTGVANGLNLAPCAPQVAIAPAPGVAEPTVARGCVGDSVQFQGAAYNVPAGVSVAWQWTFPGGQPAVSTRPNPTVAYAAPGLYDVTLTATVPGAPVGSLTLAGFARIAARAGALSGPLVETFEEPLFPLAPANPLAASWEVTADPPAATWAYTAAAAWRGTGAVRVPLSAPGTRYVLTSPTITSPTGLNLPVLVFEQAYAPTQAPATDRLEVAVSTDCGRTWTTRQRRAGASLARGNAPTGGAPFVPAPASWHEERMPLLTALAAGVPLRVRFTALAAGGGTLYLDHLRLEDRLVLSTDADPDTGTTPDVLPLALTAVPNPSDGADPRGATLHLTLPPASTGTLRLTDATGRRLGPLKPLTGGAHRVSLRELAGPLAAGLYFAELTTTDGARLTTRVLVY